MTKPIIGITANVRPNPAHEDVNWSYAPTGFVEGVQRAGGLAILLPVSDPSEAKSYISMIDKLIVSLRVTLKITLLKPLSQTRQTFAS